MKHPVPPGQQRRPQRSTGMGKPYPPLSAQDKTIWKLVLALACAPAMAIASLVFFVSKHIALRNPAVAACEPGISSFCMLPLAVFLAFTVLLPVILPLRRKQPIFGNPKVHYGSAMWDPNTYPLFGPQRRTVPRDRSPQQLESRRRMWKLWAIALVLLSALACFGIFERTCLMTDGRVLRYSAFNQETELGTVADCTHLTICASSANRRHSTRRRYYYYVILEPSWGRKMIFETGDFLNSHNAPIYMLALRNAFDPQDITVEQAELVPGIISDQQPDAEEAALLRQLFAPAR